MLETAALEAELDTTAYSIVRKQSVAPAAEKSAASSKPAVNTHMHAGVARSFLSIHLFMFAVLFATFAGDGETVFMIEICVFYFAMYLGTPYVMLRVKGDRLEYRSTWSDFLNRPFETWTGLVPGRAAWLQICLVPLAVTIALTGICVIIIAVRP